jgi:hypothetical protein
MGRPSEWGLGRKRAVGFRFLDLVPERAGPVNAEILSSAQKKASSSRASATAGSSGWPFDVGVEHGGEELALELVGFQFRHIDIVGGKTAERLVQRGRHVAHPEDEGA